jgi:NADH-quinone oxidoreductase subunit A
MEAFPLALSYLQPYLPLALYATLVALTGLALLSLPRLLGPHRRTPQPAKESPYECGVPLLGEARQRFSVKFYLVALLFVLFDIEAVFLFPWAVIYRGLGLYGLIEMLVFVGLLFVGYLYAWKRGGLDWE